MIDVPHIRYSRNPATLPSAIETANAWKLDAACRHADNADDWYTSDRHAVARAKAVCSACPVIDTCRDAGRDEPSGIWGGLTHNERRQHL